MRRGGINRRQVLSGAAALAFATKVSGATWNEGEARPNILWIVSEDNNPFIGAYGDPIARTPVLDRLAGEGILYRNVYSNAPVCAPSRFGILTGVYPESCGPAEHMRARAHLPEEIRTYPELMREAGYFCTNNAKTDYNCDVDPQAIWDRQGHDAHWRDRPEGKPFLSVFNLMTTHESRIFKPTDGDVTPADVRVPAYLPDLPEIRQDFASYYNLMTRMDGEVGARLAELEADGLAEDTIVFYYSDNGGVMPRSKRYCYDEGLRCAMIVRVPAKFAHLSPNPPGSVEESPVSFIDLAPTVLSLAGRKSPATMQGHAFLGRQCAPAQQYAFGMRNRMDERYDFVRTVTDGRFRYIRNYAPHRPCGQHQAFAWLAKGYQAYERAWLAGECNAAQSRFFEPRGYEEFYDLENDPDEVHNLAGDPAFSKQLAEMSRALDAQMIAINDNGFIAEGMAGEGYDASREHGAYPLPAIMALAASAARADAAQASHFGSLLTHADPLMRYWAATGLLILGEAASAAERAIAKALQAEQVPQVRVVLAEAATHVGMGRQGVDDLVALLGKDQSDAVRLQAINALTYVAPALARAAMPAIVQAKGDAYMFVRNCAIYLEAVLLGRYEPSMKIFDMNSLPSKTGAGE
ncbi:sulfatase [Novosphingobium sp. KN65.2]|uniref:sulfatase family protein n=1 Tax=Novosphingobium sp. KN65.2 TaxID=1478134 RepID=UPI0005E15C98|nr:sulfatase [Novosphingobium sp. KN65.2]CDO38336.1 Sulfatase [Novosphingobium sp. KN65.2]